MIMIMIMIIIIVCCQQNLKRCFRVKVVTRLQKTKKCRLDEDLTFFLPTPLRGSSLLKVYIQTGAVAHEHPYLTGTAVKAVGVKRTAHLHLVPKVK